MADGWRRAYRGVFHDRLGNRWIRNRLAAGPWFGVRNVARYSNSRWRSARPRFRYLRSPPRAGTQREVIDILLGASLGLISGVIGAFVLYKIVKLLGPEENSTQETALTIAGFLFK